MEGEAQRVTRGDRAFVTNRAEGISFGLPGEPVTLGSQRRIPTSQSWAYGFLSRKSYKPHHWVQRNLVSSFERFLCDPMVRLRGDMSLGTCREPEEEIFFVPSGHPTNELDFSCELVCGKED